jgi:hypothetical protein
MMDSLRVGSMNSADPQVAAEAFSRIGWFKPATLFECYLVEQAAGTRSWPASRLQRR